MRSFAANTHNLNRLSAIGIPFLIAGISFSITHTQAFGLNPERIANAILFDMLITGPALYYIVIRKSSIPKISTLRVFLLSLFLAGLIVDETNTASLHYLKTFVYPFIEVVLILFIGKRVYRAGKTIGRQKQDTDFINVCRSILLPVIGNERFSNLLAAELATVYYAFFPLNSRKADQKSSFSMHKESGLAALLYTLTAVISIETAVTHLLLRLWNEIVAWLATGLSLYTCLQLFAHIRAMNARLITVGEYSLHICNGLAAEALIDYTNIKRVELSGKITPDLHAVKLALLPRMEEHNVVIHLNQPATVLKLFGIKRQASVLLFRTDAPREFIDVINGKL